MFFKMYNKCPDFRGNTLTCVVKLFVFLNKGSSGSGPICNHYQVNLLKTKLVCLAFRYICLKSLDQTVMIFVWGLAIVPDYIKPYTVPKANITIHNKLHDLIISM